MIVKTSTYKYSWRCLVMTEPHRHLIRTFSLIAFFVLSIGCIAACSSSTPSTPSSATVKPTASALQRVDITPENFSQYFAWSLTVQDFNKESQDSLTGLPVYDISGDVQLSIESRYPCELHGIEFTFNVSADLSWTWSGFRHSEEKPQSLSFSGIIPQSGSYFSHQNVMFKNKVQSLNSYDRIDLTYSEHPDAVTGYILIDSRDINAE